MLSVVIFATNLENTSFLLISRLNKSTLKPSFRLNALSIRLIVHALFPTDGLAPTVTNIPGPIPPPSAASNPLNVLIPSSISCSSSYSNCSNVSDKSPTFRFLDSLEIAFNNSSISDSSCLVGNAVCSALTFSSLALKYSRCSWLAR